MILLGCNSILHGWEDAWQWLLGMPFLLPILVLRLRAWIQGRHGKIEEVIEEGQGCAEGCQEATSVTH